MSFEEYWKARGSLICLETRKAVAEDAWNSAIEHIRTTEPMPVSERILAVLLRIEGNLINRHLEELGIPIGRIVRATAKGWTDIREVGGVWMGDAPGERYRREIP